MDRSNREDSNRKKIKLFYLVDFLRTDLAGTEKQLIMLIKNLPRSRYTITLLSLQRSIFLEKFGDILPDLGSIILDAQSDISKSLPALFRLYNELRKNRPDILHTFFPASNSLGVIIARIAGVSRIVSSRRDMGYWQTKKDLIITRLANRFVSHVVANSFAVRAHAIRTEGIPEHKTSVIHNALDTIQSSTVADRPIERDTPIVGILANLNRPVKRVDLFIKAAALVKKKHPEVKLWVIGDGILRPDLEGLASKLGLNPNVAFWGRCGDVREILKEMTVGVICSDSEGFSNSIMEYMETGLPVVATDVGGNPELVSHEETGLLVPPNNAGFLANAISALLKNPEVARSMGNKGRQRILKDFSMEEMLRKNMMFYESLIVQH